MLTVMRAALGLLPLVLLGLAMAWRPPAVALGDPGSTPVPAPIVRLTGNEIAQAPATITRLIDAHLAQHGVAPQPPIDDATFARRVWLAIAGRIPTPEEIAPFLRATDPGKRAALIDQLLASPARVHGEFAWWADLLRVQSRLADRYPGQNYIRWLKQALADNTRYDAMVRALVTAEGPALADGNGATGFYLRDAGMPLDHAALTAQTFLGTRIGCAQCHDHPTDRWKRSEFHAFAAYTAGSDAVRELPKDLRGRLRGEQVAPEVRKALQTFSNTIAVRVKGTFTSTLALPHDYQYADFAPGTKVPATPLFGAAPVAPRADPRPVFARWLTAPENPRFTLAIANRLWKRAFGVGLIEPVDDLTDRSVASNPELMDFLVRLMVSVDYDLVAFQRAIWRSAAWQRAPVAREPAPGEPFRFAGPLARRLSAEQVWDSLLTLAVDDPDTRTGDDGAALVGLYARLKDKPADELLAVATKMAEARREAQELQQQIQALRQRVAKARPADQPALRQQLRALTEKREALQAMAEPLRPGGPRREGKEAQLLRAAELPQPAPPGHFLRVFGQSDRETIDNASREPAVTQALTLMNGIDERLLAPNTPLARAVATGDAATRARALWRAVLTREPTAAELRTAIAWLTAHPDAAGLKDLAWALVNGAEFLHTP